MKSNNLLGHGIYMYQQLYRKIQTATCYVTVFENDEIISDGTGFCFLPSGEVMTAAHVVTGRLPIKQDDVTDPNVNIFVKFQGVPLLQYKVAICGMKIDNETFSRPIQIDVAILIPLEKKNINFPVLKANVNPPRLGEELFLAGFSDEIELPFMLQTLIKKGTPGLKEFSEAMKKGYDADMMSLMIKRGIVGNVKRVIFESKSLINLIELDIFYVDNGIHSGASGGPVVNKNGVAAGIITQRAITKVPFEETPYLKVPSGSTMGISLQFLRTLSEWKP